MEELKMQNSLLLQLVSGLQRQINSKNRQNQILFQQYEQLAADNQQLQLHAHALRTHNHQLKSQNPPINNPLSSPKNSPFQVEIAELKKINSELRNCIDELKAQLQEKGGTIIFLQEELQRAKLAAYNVGDSSAAMEQARSAKEMLILKEQTVSELTEYMQAQSNKIDELTRAGIIAIDNYETKISEKDTLIQDLNQQAAQLNQRLTSLTSEKEAQQQTNLQMKREESSVDAKKLKELQTIILSKEQSIAELSEFLQMQSDKVSRLQNNLSQSNLQNLQAEIQNLKQIVESKQQSITQLSDFLNTLSLNNKEMQQRLQIMQEDKNESIVREIDILRARLSTKEVELSALSSKLQQKQAEITSLRVQLDEKIVKITMFQTISEQNDTQFPNDYNQTEQEAPSSTFLEVHQSEKVDYEALIQLKTNLIQSLKATLQQKDQSLRDFTQFISQQTQKMGTLQKNIEDLQAIIRNKEQSIEELRTFLQESYAKNADTDSNLKQSQYNAIKMQLQIDELKKPTTENVNEQKVEILLPSSEEIQVLTSSEQQSNLQNQQKISVEEELRNQIAQIQFTLKSKDENINQLTDFMSQQAEELQELRSKLSEAKEQQQAFLQMQKDKQQISLILDEAIKSAAIKEEQYTRIISKLQEQLSQRSQKIQTPNLGQDIQLLKQTIKELEETIKTKDENFAQLSEFMNQQSLQIQQLEEKLNNQTEGNSNINHGRVQELQIVIKSKEVSIAELTQFLEEAYAKNAQLQQIVITKPQQAQPSSESSDNNWQAIQERKFLLQSINSQIQQKNAKLAQMTTLLYQTTKQKTQQQQNFAALKVEIEQAKSNYDCQLEEFNHHRQTIEKEMVNIAHALEEQVHHKKQQQKNIALLQEQANQLRSEIKRLQQQKISLSPRIQTQNTQQITDDNAVIAQMQAKITQYQGFLNDREQEMATMMQVMQNLQAEISNKNQLINHLQETKQQNIQQANPPDKARVQQLQEQVNNLKQIIENSQGIQNEQRMQSKLQGQYQRMQMKQELIYQSNKLKQRYEQQLKEMKAEQANLQRQLNLQGNFENDEVQNNEQLTVLQAIQQILVYSQGQIDIESIMRMIQVLKRSYLRQNECILKQNNELKDSLNSLVDVNNRLVTETQNLKAQVDQLRQMIQEKDQLLEKATQREIKQLRKSINESRDESPIGRHAREEDLNTINKLEQQVIALRQQNQQKEVQLAQFKTSSNKNFVNELNNLLDSRTVAKEGEQIKEIEEQLQRMTIERDQIASKCKEYEKQIANLQKQCSDLATQLQNAPKNQAQTAPIRNSQGRDSLHTAQLLAGLEGHVRQSQRHVSELYQQQSQRWRAQNEQLHMLLQEKNAAISQLQETMLGLEKGYNSEIMSLRKNIAQLKNEAIALRKSLYQANPDGVDIAELIKDTFSQSKSDTEFFRPPAYTHSLIPAPQQNYSYYSDAQHVPRPSTNYQRHFEPSTQLNLGQKFMGRRCRQASPFNYGQASRMTAWEQFHRY